MMKKLLLILLCLPMIGFGQNVNIPDANFKAYLVGEPLINTNGDSEIQLSEATAFNGGIYCDFMNISDLTGIEAFTNLTAVACSENQITSIDLSANTDLTSIYCRDNQLTSIDVSQNLALFGLDCGINQLTSLNVSANTALINLDCGENQITSLDVSQNLDLEMLIIWSNQITTLDISNNTSLYRFYARHNLLYNLDARNGNNQNMWHFYISYNPNLTCVNVDDVNYSDTNWTVANTFIDLQHYFSSNCITQFPGCTDLLACNYDSLANVDDSSCIYPVIWQQAFPICNGDSVIVGSSVYNTTGNYIDTLTAVNGCDSIVYTDVTSNFPTIWYQTYLICDGDSVAVGSSVYDAPGNYMDTLISANGCDSIVQTYLMIDENTSLYDTLSVGASIVWNGISLNASGDYSVTLINSVGCDSIVNLNLTVTTTGILDIANNKNNLVKITDMLGQETPYRKNTPLFYIFDDGTVEKRIVIE